MGKDRPGEPVAGPRLLIGVAPDAARQEPAGDPARRALYGRSRGKKLRAYHARLIDERLPQLEIEQRTIGDCRELFPSTPSEVWLEIGFGGAEHLLAQARARRDVGFIACEPFINGVAKALAGIEEDQLDNVRLRAGDAGALIAGLPDRCLSRIFILYPDPWPKRRQNKRRLISEPMVRELARVAQSGACVRFATDVDDYAGWALQRFLGSADFVWLASEADDWRRPWADWHATRYEAKAAREQRRPVYLTFQRL
jgi:tRNA (guanine-N7-)-methyltransferase